MYKGSYRKLVIFLIVIITCNIIVLGMSSKLFENNEIERLTKQMLNDMNVAYLNQDEESLKAAFDLDILYGKWAYEYAAKKLDYLKKWEEKQGIEYIDIKSEYKFTKISGSEQVYNLTVKSIDEYIYKYKGDTKKNSYKIAVYHYMRIEMKKDRWVITKDWFSDPMADRISIDDKTAEITQYINNYSPQEYKLEGRRKKAVEYADKYSSAQINSSYNDNYRNYNPVGGDCANFASQILYEGGGFKKNSVWNYHKGGSLAWIKAYNLTHFLLNNGRASRIAVGSYESVYKASYKLQPGDIVAYEEKGDIKHVSVVTGYDSKGYALVSCHNVDRHRVPWDLGWNRPGIKFWLVRVHY